MCDKYDRQKSDSMIALELMKLLKKHGVKGLVNNIDKTNILGNIKYMFQYEKFSTQDALSQIRYLKTPTKEYQVTHKLDKDMVSANVILERYLRFVYHKSSP